MVWKELGDCLVLARPAPRESRGRFQEGRQMGKCSEQLVHYCQSHPHLKWDLAGCLYGHTNVFSELQKKSVHIPKNLQPNWTWQKKGRWRQSRRGTDSLKFTQECCNRARKCRATAPASCICSLTTRPVLCGSLCCDWQKCTENGHLHRLGKCSISSSRIWKLQLYTEFLW